MTPKKLTPEFIRSLIKSRKKDSHKGAYGHVLVLAGSSGMPGAAVLSTGGALRSGAGLVTCAVVKSLRQVAAKRMRPEAMILVLSESESETFSLSSFLQIKKYIDKRKITSIVLGPGIGVNKNTSRLTEKILLNIALPVVLDADGINVLKGKHEKIFKKVRAKIILTPHAGELSRLINTPVQKIQADRINAARQFAKKNSVICVLKGHKTIVSDGKNTFINTTGNPGMATGGSGDVLSGIIAGLNMLVSEPKPLNSALAGVYLHGLAGDFAKKEKTEQSLLAGDIIENIPKAVKRVMNG